VARTGMSTPAGRARNMVPSPSAIVVSGIVGQSWPSCFWWLVSAGGIGGQRGSPCQRADQGALPVSEEDRAHAFICVRTAASPGGSRTPRTVGPIRFRDLLQAAHVEADTRAAVPPSMSYTSCDGTSANVCAIASREYGKVPSEWGSHAPHDLPTPIS